MVNYQVILSAINYHLEIVENKILKLWHQKPADYTRPTDTAMLTDYGTRAIALADARAAIIQIGALPSGSTTLAIIIDAMSAYIGSLEADQIDGSNQANIARIKAVRTELEAL